MKCYDCGHQVHGSDECTECDCPDWKAMARLDGKLRERPHLTIDDQA